MAESEARSASDNKKRIEKAVVLLLGLAGAAYMVMLLQLFFTGIDEWKWLGVKIQLRPWWKPLWIGIGLWLVMLGVARDEPRLFAKVRELARRAIRPAGFTSERAGFGWAVWGGFIGAVLACLFTVQYYYLFPLLAARIGLVIAAFAFSAGLHYFFFRKIEFLLPRIWKNAPPWRYTSTRMAGYLIFIGFMASVPLSNWEALGTDPIVPELARAIPAAALLVWLSLAAWRLGGTLGKVRRAAVPVTAVVAIIASAVSWNADREKLNAPAPRDRVILITLDTTRADFLSCYGYPRPTSPNLDKLAASGARFTRVFCPKGETDPSHASVLTGTYPRTHGLLTNYMAVTGKVDCMASVFQDHGYETIAITSRSHLHPWTMNLPGFTDISAPTLAAQSTSAYDAYRRLANKLIEYRDRDVFIWLHFFDPHASYKYHKGYSEEFVKDYHGDFVAKGHLKPGQHISEKDVQYSRDLYAGEIHYMDYWIGRCLDLIRQTEPRPEREPFILVIADHGEVLGDYQDREARYAYGHGGVLYNASARIPMIVAWPGTIPAGQALSQIAESEDVAPTMLDYIFGDTAFPAQGMSLKPVLQEGAPSDNLAISFRSKNDSLANPYYHHLQHAVIRDDWKLIYSETAPPELYNLADDWAEEHNVSARNPQVVDALHGELEDWLKRTPETKPVNRDLSKGEISVLRALGYIQ